MEFINWTISLGTIVEVIVVLGGGAVFVATMKERINKMDAKIGALETRLGGLTDVLMKIALQEQRMQQFEKMIDELRHGQGFIRLPFVIDEHGRGGQIGG